MGCHHCTIPKKNEKEIPVKKEDSLGLDPGKNFTNTNMIQQPEEKKQIEIIYNQEIKPSREINNGNDKNLFADRAVLNLFPLLFKFL